MKPITEVNEADFETEVLKSDRPVLVDFWAASQGPGKTLAPALDEIAAEHAGRIKIAKVNVDENPNLAAHYHIHSIPTLIYFNNGLVQNQITGAADKRAIISEFGISPGKHALNDQT
ncbi:MAG TPA: thioredoxin [Verrucomicrobiae bacterium]|jgi:thioredoxin 1